MAGRRSRVMRRDGDISRRGFCSAHGICGTAHPPVQRWLFLPGGGGGTHGSCVVDILRGGVPVIGRSVVALTAGAPGKSFSLFFSGIRGKLENISSFPHRSRKTWPPPASHSDPNTSPVGPVRLPRLASLPGLSKHVSRHVCVPFAASRPRSPEAGAAPTPESRGRKPAFFSPSSRLVVVFLLL